MAESLRVSFGRRVDNGKPVIVDITKGSMIVAGSPGSGKSVFLHAIVAPLVGRMSQKRINIYLGDPKRIEFQMYKDAAQVKRIARTAEDHCVMLEELVAVMEGRYQWMEARGLRSMVDTTFLPNILVVIDEYADVVMDRKYGRRISEYTAKLVRLGRAAAITVIIATQYPIAKIIDTEIKANCPVRVCFRVASLINSRVVLDRAGAEKLHGMGRMLLQTPTENEVTEIQTGLISDELIKYQVWISNKKYGSINRRDRVPANVG